MSKRRRRRLGPAQAAGAGAETSVGERSEPARGAAHAPAAERRGRPGRRTRARVPHGLARDRRPRGPAARAPRRSPRRGGGAASRGSRQVDPVVLDTGPQEWRRVGEVDDVQLPRDQPVGVGAGREEATPIDDLHGEVDVEALAGIAARQRPEETHAGGAVLLLEQPRGRHRLVARTSERRPDGRVAVPLRDRSHSVGYRRPEVRRGRQLVGDLHAASGPSRAEASTAGVRAPTRARQA